MWGHLSQPRSVWRQSLRQEFMFWLLIRYAIPGNSTEGRREWAEKEGQHKWGSVLQSWLLFDIKFNGFLHLLRPSSERHYTLLQFRIVHGWVVLGRKTNISAGPFLWLRDLTCGSLTSQSVAQSEAPGAGMKQEHCPHVKLFNIINCGEIKLFHEF